MDVRNLALTVSVDGLEEVRAAIEGMQEAKVRLDAAFAGLKVRSGPVVDTASLQEDE